MVRGDLQNKNIIGDTWYTTTSTRTLKYFLADVSKHKTRVQQLYFIGAFLHFNVKHIFFVMFDKRCREHFPYYYNYFGRSLILMNSMYGMTISGKIFVDDITNCLIYVSDFKQPQCQMFMYYNYEPYDSKLLLLSYIYDRTFWYTYEELVKWFVDTLGKRFYVNFL